MGGLFLGLAALTIPVVLLTIVVVGAWVFYWGRHSRPFLASLLLFGAALNPWALDDAQFSRSWTGDPSSSDFEEYLPEVATPETNVREDTVNAILRGSELYGGHFARSFVRFWELYPSLITMSDPRYREKLHAEDPRIITETIYTPNWVINAVSILSTGPIFFFALLGTAAMCLRRDMRRELSILWIMLLSFAVGYTFFSTKTSSMISARFKLARRI